MKFFIKYIYRLSVSKACSTAKTTCMVVNPRIGDIFAPFFNYGEWGLRLLAWLLTKPVMINNFASLFNCTSVNRTLVCKHICEPTNGMEANKRILQSVLRFIKASHRFDWLLLVTSFKMYPAYSSASFYSVSFLSLSILYYFKTWPTFYSRPNPSLFYPAMTCLPLLCSVLFCWFAVLICYMSWIRLLPTALPQRVKRVCVKEWLLMFKTISNTYDIALSHCTTRKMLL